MGKISKDDAVDLLLTCDVRTACGMSCQCCKYAGSCESLKNEIARFPENTLVKVMDEFYAYSTLKFYQVMRKKDLSK